MLLVVVNEINSNQSLNYSRKKKRIGDIVHPLSGVSMGEKEGLYVGR